MRKKIIFNEDSIIAGAPGVQLEYRFNKGIEYLVDADLAEGLIRIHGPRIEHMEDVQFPKTRTVFNAKSILIYRAGGIGDILFIGSYLSAIKKANPEVEIAFWTMQPNIPILKLIPEIDIILDKPLEFKYVIDSFDLILPFDSFIEKSVKAETVNAYDLAEDFFDGIQREPTFSTKLKYTGYDKLNGKKIHIGIAYTASAQIRMVSPFIYFDLLIQLDPSKYRVTCFLQVQFLKDFQDFKVRVHMYNPQLELASYVDPDVGKVAAFSIEGDPISMGLGPDSGLINLWGYHGVPVIGLFGPFNSKLRLKYYDYAIGLDPVTTCPFGKNEFGNCFDHVTTGCKLADLKEEVHSPCIHLIKSEHILKAILKVEAHNTERMGPPVGKILHLHK